MLRNFKMLMISCIKGKISFTYKAISEFGNLSLNLFKCE